MPPYFTQMTQEPISEADVWSPLKRRFDDASQMLDPTAPMGGMGFSGLGGLAAGSAAKFRTPMRAQIQPQQKLRDSGNSNEPYQLIYPDDQYQTSYRLRNRLGEPKFNATVDFNLDNKNKSAYLQHLSIERGRREAWSKPSGHAGARPDQFTEIMGRVAEELQGAGFNNIKTNPTTAGRTRLYDRAFRQLSNDPRLAPGAKLDMPPQEGFLRDPYVKANESPAMRGVMERKLAVQRPMDRAAQNAEETIRYIRSDISTRAENGTLTRAYQQASEARIAAIESQVNRPAPPSAFDELTRLQDQARWSNGQAAAYDNNPNIRHPWSE